jgi:hypothetical protein
MESQRMPHGSNVSPLEDVILRAIANAEVHGEYCVSTTRIFTAIFGHEDQDGVITLDCSTPARHFIEKLVSGMVTVDDVTGTSLFHTLDEGLGPSITREPKPSKTIHSDIRRFDGDARFWVIEAVENSKRRNCPPDEIDLIATLTRLSCSRIRDVLSEITQYSGVISFATVKDEFEKSVAAIKMQNVPTSVESLFEAGEVCATKRARVLAVIDGKDPAKAIGTHEHIALHRELDVAGEG